MIGGVTLESGRLLFDIFMIVIDLNVRLENLGAKAEIRFINFFWNQRG